MPDVRLIVNADDFGASPEVNEAVTRAHREGVLTSCSLMVTGDAFDQAVRIAKEHPTLAVGIHLVTVMGRSVLPPREIPSLVDAAGNFSDRPTSAGLRYYFSARARRELRRELAAQFEKFLGTGLVPSHIDSHLHMHVHPVIFRAALDLGARHGVRCMRVPVGELSTALAFERRPLVGRSAYAAVFGVLGWRMRRQLPVRGFRCAARVYGNLMTGRMGEAYFLHVLARLRAVTNEIYLHPAVEVDGAFPRLAGQRRREFEALTSRSVARRMAELGVRASTYAQLEAPG